jgi:hypothetical protein
MKKISRTLFTAAALLIGGGTASAQAQETNTQVNNTVGNPQLRDFELPGTRTTPPPPAEPQAATPPPVAAPTTTLPAPAPSQAGPATGQAAPAARPPSAAEARDARSRVAAPAQPAAAPPSGLPTPEAVREALPAPVETPLAVAPPPVTAPPADTAPVETAPAPAEDNGGFPWLYAGLGGLAVLLAAAAFAMARRRAKRDEETEEQEVAPVALAEPAPAPAPATASPAPAPPRSDVVGIQMRPWIEIEFVPARAAATATEASVQFELKLRNTGSAPARNVRIEVRMFNAGPHQEQEIMDFYGEPIRERTPPALAMLPPKTEAQVTSAVAMPNDQVREVTIQGRRLFIPTVAFNIVYEWGNGKTGQSSSSYLVGREAETPTQKMGGFRLDLGPRLYRSVGQRPTRLARTV